MSRFFKIDKAVLLDVQRWAYGRTTELATEFEIHPNTLYAQLRGERFNGEIWRSLMGKMREQRVDPTFLRRVVLYYSQCSGYSRAMFNVEWAEQKNMLINTDHNSDIVV